MENAIYGTHARTPALPVYPFALGDAVRSAEAKILAAPDVAANHAELADLYLFENELADARARTL